jgi:hypothetical protein
MNMLRELSYDGGDVMFDKFDLFCCSNECVILMMTSQPIAPILAAPHAVMTSTQSELVTFKKGIKHDAALYPILSQDMQWDLWNRSVVSLARAQSVEQVLDNKYLPVLLDEIALFSEKNNYLYAVFERTLQLDKGRPLCAHTKTRLAHRKSTKKCMTTVIVVLGHN